VLALIILASHGAHFVALRTSGTIHDRAGRLATRLWPAVVMLSLVGLLATVKVRPGVVDNYRRWPIGWVIPAIVLASAIAMAYGRRARRDLAAFVASSLFIAAMLAGAAFALFPLLLPSSNGNPGLTAFNALAPAYGLSIGVRWWTAAFVLAVAYVVWMYRAIGTKLD
jgi:cytochrome d ubiquinol oxidase subunit II